MSHPTTITAVTTCPDDPGLCMIRVGRRRIGPLRRDDAERLGLREGRAWSAVLARQADRLVASTALRRTALAALGRTALSARALSARLVSRGADADLVDEVLAGLAADGWLDDGRSAESRARSIRRRGAVARGALDSALELEGFRPRDRRAAIAADAASDRDMAMGETRTRLARGESAPTIARRLARRGFEADIIREALRRCGCTLEDELE